MYILYYHFSILEYLFHILLNFFEKESIFNKEKMKYIYITENPILNSTLTIVHNK